jgi:hypothetical protein
MQYMDSLEIDWVENHIHTYINIAGPVLGVPKSIPAFLSGAAFCSQNIDYSLLSVHRNQHNCTEQQPIEHPTE